MFLHLSVILFTGEVGGMCGWEGVCVWQGGMHGGGMWARGTCMAGEGACVAGGHAW